MTKFYKTLQIEHVFKLRKSGEARDNFFEVISAVITACPTTGVSECALYYVK